MIFFSLKIIRRMPPKKKAPAKAKAKSKCIKKPAIKQPSKHDPLYKFYVSLFKQNPQSKMAIRWLCENGLGHIVINMDDLEIK